MARLGRDDHEERAAATEDTPLLAPVKDYQTHILPHKPLLMVFAALALVQFTSFLDQTAISTTLPAIASSLNTGSSISWVGASFLTTSTSIQLINGRLSDIFGRKACLITTLAIMGFGNFLSGLSQTPTQLYATRAFTGFGAGAINALVQIAVSDITTLEQRGYYFGILGIAVALGNGLGPVVGGWLTELTSWRWAFWFICPLTMGAIVHLGFVLPSSTAPEDIWAKLKKIDWLGVCTSMLAIVFILIPVSQGGSSIGWNSPFTCGMLIIGVLLFIAFIVIEWRFVKYPVLPMHLFKNGRSTNILLGLNLMIGWVFWGNLFYIPLYFQNVRGCSPAVAGSYILPMVIAHGMTSGLTGIGVAYLGHYMPIIRSGAFLWAVGASVKALLYNQSSPVWMFFVLGIFEGYGVGCSLQPALVGLLAGSHNADRAVMTGLRNFLRDIGVSGAILNNTLQRSLQAKFTSDLISQLTSSAFALGDLPLSNEDKQLISSVYLHGVKRVFLSYAGLMIFMFVLSLFIEDYGLQRKQPNRADSESESDNESGYESEL
ncbi:hypothetical protein AWENTII_011932 [Aspergillus wentii]|nr:hypothetical protein MW887_005732 [Aspergillus wentii]